MPSFLAVFFGIISLFNQQVTPPDSFIHGALTRANIVNTFEAGDPSGFIGLEWVCDEAEARYNGKANLTPQQLADEMGTTYNDLPVELCYSGFGTVEDLDAGTLSYEWMTGP